MYIEANEFYGLAKFFSDAGYYETLSHTSIYNNITASVPSGGIYALTGAIGSGKTTSLNKIRCGLEERGDIIVSRSLATEKRSLAIHTFFIALFYDLAPKGKVAKIPPNNEKREHELIELMKKHKKTVVLFIDEAHDILESTLLDLKQLIETVDSRGCKLSVVMAGRQKLGNVLSTAAMNKIGVPAKIFSIDDAFSNKEKYITWLIKECLQDKKKVQEIIAPEAIQKLAISLQTPLQIQNYLTKSVRLGHQRKEKAITPELIEQVLKAP